MPGNGGAWLKQPLAVAAALSLGAGGASGQAITVAQGDGPLSGASKRWRVLNLDTVTYGWAIGELRLFSDTACSQELVGQTPGSSPSWQAIASGDHSAPAARALDGATWTEWKAQCYLCNPREAWLGVSFSAPVKVTCLKLWQWGRQGYRTGEVLLERWEESTAAWQPVLLGRGLDGGRWDTLGFVRCGAVEDPEYGRVEVSNQGYFPSEATFTCSGARIMGGERKLSCLPDGSWEGEPPRCWALMQLIVLLAVIFAFDVSLFVVYYFFIMSRKAKALQPMSFIPEEQYGHWSHEMIADVKYDQKCVFLQFLCCPCCRVADTWRGMGQLPFVIGAPLLHVLLPLLPCVGAYLRGSMRHRLGIRGQRLGDLTVWLCCLPCAAVQEAKTCDAVCQVAEEEAAAMREDALRKQEVLEKHHQAAYEQAGGLNPARLGRGEGDAPTVPEARPPPSAAGGGHGSGNENSLVNKKSRMSVAAAAATQGGRASTDSRATAGGAEGRRASGDSRASGPPPPRRSTATGAGRFNRATTVLDMGLGSGGFV